MELEDKDSSESKRSKRKSEKNKELSAAEKFNNFKKQRTENKEGDIVDDLFKDFIAKKMKEIDCERGKGAGQSEASELNKFLDKEIKHINVPPPAVETNGESLVTVKEEPIETEEEPLLPPLNRERKDSESETIAPVVPIKTEAKKQVIGFKNFGIKLSLTSTELIKSGDVHKKGKRLEEGEVLSSEKSDDSDSSSDGEADDDDGDAGEVSGTGSISDTDKDKSKKKKRKKKLKHKKKKKHKEKEKEKEKEEENNDQNVLVVKEEKNSSKRKVSITPKSRSKSPSKKHKKSRSRSKERRKKSRSRSGSRSKDRRKRSRSRSKDRRKRSRSKDRRKRSRSRSKDRRKRSRSKSKDRSRSKHKRSRSRERRKRSRSRSKHRRSRSGSRSRRRSPSPPPDPFWRSRYGNFDAHMFMKRERERERRHGRSRSRSKTPDRERDRFLAKEKKRMEDLRLKIDKAKLREIAIKNAVEMAKSGGGPQVDVTFKSGGKSVEELTDFCKRISSKDERRSHYPDSSSDEEVTQRPATDDEDDLIHHPFKVKEAPIVMDIKNAKQLPNVTPAERLAQTGVLRLQFPVSSGSQHREKEWVPVEKPNPQAVTATAPQGAGDPAAAAAPPPEVKVFEDPPPEPMDISSIIAERLSAVRKLAENPHDMSAKTVLTAAQKKASQWANARNLPGQFIGSTGANIMTQEELIGPDKKRQAWLKKDVFTNAAPVKSGIGMFLLQRMGWKQGEGLGKNNEGRVDPLLLDVKTDRKGLVTIGEGKKGGGGGGGAAAPRVPAIKDLSGKHPVSALVEFCNKRRFGSPQFEVIHESGPDHKKNFLFKVKVNGTEYQPSIASNNKKLAKAQAATVVLQEFGLVPRTVAV